MDTGTARSMTTASSPSCSAAKPSSSNYSPSFYYKPTPSSTTSSATPLLHGRDSKMVSTSKVSFTVPTDEYFTVLNKSLHTRNIEHVNELRHHFSMTAVTVRNTARNMTMSFSPSLLLALSFLHDVVRHVLHHALASWPRLENGSTSRTDAVSSDHGQEHSHGYEHSQKHNHDLLTPILRGQALPIPLFPLLLFPTLSLLHDIVRRILTMPLLHGRDSKMVSKSRVCHTRLP
ncbi:hypothetical protein TIFTF001_013076 [Ficus carica]|uniref:Uncharacterized protein n=1 Tax=Ficus carica TaxID=3494 RepID=A0AA87ZUA8_FICCA|nr:hypothetical protein TIFTF001_013076 [Ficus carica]